MDDRAENEIEIIFDAAQKIGFDDAEIFISIEKHRRARMDHLTAVSTALCEDCTVIFRGIYKGRMGVAMCNSLERKNMLDMVEKASHTALKSSSVVCFPPSREYPPAGGHKTNPPDMDELVELLKHGASCVKDTIFLDSLETGYNETTKMVANTQGVSVSHTSAFHYGTAVMANRENASLPPLYDSYICRDRAPVEEMVNTLSTMVGALHRKAAPAKRRIMVAPGFVSGIQNVFVPAILGIMYHTRESPLIEKKGKKVISEKLTILDDGNTQKGMPSCPFDDEGSPSRRTEVFSSGVFTSFLWDYALGSRYGEESTGNGIRSLNTGEIKIAPTVLIFQEGPRKYRDLLSEADCFLPTLDVLYYEAETGNFSCTVNTPLAVEEGAFVGRCQALHITDNVYHFLSAVLEASKEVKILPCLMSPYLLMDGTSIHFS